MPSVKPETYRARVVDAQIERYLELFGAVEVSGTKWCGKTWTSLAHAQSVTYVDRGANLAVVSADPSFALAGDAPHVIDEWQRVPAIWDTVRHAVDDLGAERGRWILTGSSTPNKGEVAHSGAGRIGRVRMRPMTLAESSESSAAISLAGLFEGRFTPQTCTGSVAELAELCCRGGWPAHIESSALDALAVAREYLAATFSQSVPSLGGNEQVARRLALSVARNLGQSPTNATLAKDVFAHDTTADVTDAEVNTVSRHMQILAQLYLVDDVEGWVPASRSPKRMRVKPRRYYADPSLAVALLGLSPESLLQDWQTFGLVFENLCMRDLDVYARALPNASDKPLRYYHDDSNLEVDAVVERADGSWGAFEIKVSAEKVDEDARNLLAMRDKLMKDSLKRTREPQFLAVLTGTGEAAYRRPDGVYVVPIRALGV